jgi:mitochondrial splicing suppressor protein 51
MSSTSNATSSAPEDPICTSCQKPQSTFPEPLKRCGKCQTARYCSRDCQKSDWKTHKLTCGQPDTGTHNPGFNVTNQLLGLSDNKYLHNLLEKDVFVQLVDCFRLRCDDEYTYTGDGMGIYGGDVEDAAKCFEEFLDLAEKRKGLLPAWWSRAKRAECERSATRGWSDISCAVEKSDIVEHYRDPMMPMKLRVLGEKVYGKGFM